MTWFVLITSHNRCETTLACLAALGAACGVADVKAKIVLFDDGSSDGTPDKVKERVAGAEILVGDGSAYWANGMSQAESRAMELAGPGDYLLWLNDDMLLDPDSIRRLSAYTSAAPSRVIVASARDPIDGSITYAGFSRSGWHPLRFTQVKPLNTVQEVDSFNGNMVAVPASVVRRMGGIDGTYSHAFADIDYGMRLKAAGEPALLAPGTYGSCPRNAAPARRPLRDEWAAFTSVKGGGNLASLRHYYDVHAPRRRTLAIAFTYASWWARKVASRAREALSDD